MHVRLYLLSIGVACGICAMPAFAGNIVIMVGPGGQYQTISAAVAAADADADPGNYYVVNVMPGTYTNDFPYVTRPMTIRVTPGYAGQKVVLQATENLPNEKGIILATASLTVNGLTFTGAKIANWVGGNGAGIRDEITGPGSLIVRNSTFTHNQEGILDDGDPDETITIINSRFRNNGNTNPNYFQHGIYIGHSGSLTVSNSLFCGQLFGHDVKSRAAVTTVENNDLYVGEANAALGCNAGSGSFAVDVPNGGVATVSGNQIIQGDAAQNHNMVAYGEEGLTYGDNGMLVSDNSFLSTATFSATAVFDPNCVTVDLAGNSFQGVATIVNPPQCAASQ